MQLKAVLILYMCLKIPTHSLSRTGTLTMVKNTKTTTDVVKLDGGEGG